MGNLHVGRRKVLKSLFGKTFGSTSEKSPSPATDAPTRLELERIKTLIEFFPIGKKLRYYPEFKQEIVFDTLVLAYCVNGEFIYSVDAIEHDPEGFPAAFRFGEGSKRTPVSALKVFQLLVPDTSDLEMKLDYQRRAMIGRGKQFSKGNYISLISNAGGRGVSTVDTEVAKKIVLPDGPYAHSTMILLTPELKTLVVTDQRRKSRTKISTPVTVSLPLGGFHGPCTIIDISDGGVRIRVRDRGTSLPAMRRGDEILIEVDLGEAEKHYSIKGTIIRSASETCVVLLDGQFRDGRFSHFSPLDLLELKAGLISHG